MRASSSAVHGGAYSTVRAIYTGTVYHRVRGDARDSCSVVTCEWLYRAGAGCMFSTRRKLWDVSNQSNQTVHEVVDKKRAAYSL